MSQFLNTNEIALSYIKPVLSWKGRTFTQITSSIKKNKGNVIGRPIQIPQTKKGKTIGSISVNPNMFLANPVKLYRREIATSFDRINCYPRTSLSIDEFNRPGGSIINSSSSIQNGLVNTIDNILPNNKCEEPGTCSVFLSPTENAKRRCRSSGMIKPKYNPANNLASYYTNSNQYLASRSKTFQQNQYNYIRVGNSSLTPGSGLTASNIYTANGFPSCPKYNIQNDLTFQYQWLDAAYYNVTIPKGYYDANDFNGKFQIAMSQNYHFLINNSNGSKVFLLSITYDATNNILNFQSLCYNSTNFPSSQYSSDLNASSSWTNNTNSGTTTDIFPPAPGPKTSLVPGFKFINSSFAPILGFDITITNFPLFLPSQSITANNRQTYTTTQLTISNTTPALQSVYKQIYYKPNNPQFSQQGAVSSSSLINRIKYDTINTAAYKTTGNIFGPDATSKFGGNISNALAYGVSENPYTLKDKLGYPNISYPSFLPNSTEQRNCTQTGISGGVKFPTN